MSSRTETDVGSCEGVEEKEMGVFKKSWRGYQKRGFLIQEREESTEKD